MAQTNRITSAGYAYDAAGNQTRVVHADSSVQKYQYDAAGRMVKVRNANGVVLATYTYGASNQRLVSQAGDEQSSYRTYYAWGGDAVVAEYSESPSQPTSPQWTKSYVYLGARLLATLTPSGTAAEVIQYHHPDRLGTRLVTNAQDTNSFEQVTLPFGTALDAESSGATNRRFTSYDRSSVTGLDYAVNRHYDSQQGRFTQVDPIGAGASSLDDPQSWNLYAYVGNDPVNRLDPDGLFWGKIGRFFKSVGKAIVKVLSNKWVQLAIGVALVIVTLFLYSPVMFALTTGIETSSRVGIGIKILHGALAGGLLVGQVANALQDGELPDCSTGAVPCEVRSGTVNVDIFTVPIIGVIVRTAPPQIKLGALIAVALYLLLKEDPPLITPLNRLRDLSRRFSSQDRETTPVTHPEDFENVRGTRALRNKRTGEIWEKDMLHRDHWEVYRNRRDYDRGRRRRAVWDDGRLKEIF